MNVSSAIWSQQLLKKINIQSYMEEWFSKDIKYISTNYDIGELVDVIYGSDVFNCLIFVFKNDSNIIEVLANSEETSLIPISEMNLENYYALGFVRIKKLNGSIEKDFFYKKSKYRSVYKFLNDIQPYTSIAKLEDRIDLPLIKIDKGGFLFPFYTYIYSDGKHTLQIITSPNEDKEKCYFLGGWSYK